MNCAPDRISHRPSIAPRPRGAVSPSAPAGQGGRDAAAPDGSGAYAAPSAPLAYLRGMALLTYGNLGLVDGR